MITGIGTDIIEVKRILKAIERWGNHFLNHIFTDQEIAYCLRYKFPAQHFAGRFAAKEALIKALPSIKNIRWTDIEITNAPSGKPHCRLLNNDFKKTIHISISHTCDHAIAFAVIEG